MQVTNDSLTGTWTLWVRTDAQPATATYDQVSFEASADPSKGTVTIQSGGTTYSGTWQEAEFGIFENVQFQVEDPAGSGSTLSCSGYMVGLAMGGTIGEGNPPAGAWAGYKTSD